MNWPIGINASFYTQVICCLFGGTSLWERFALLELRCWNASRYGNATRYWNFVMGTLRVVGT
ncbi:MAG: hypothetical protein ACKO8Q_09095 [Bacteroidota bacterium]